MFSVLDFGAVADGKTLAREAFQAAVDACHAAGGGTVTVPAGTYLLGTVVLRSHVHIRLESGATILGSTDFENDYLPYEEVTPPCYQDISHTYFDHSLFVAKECCDIGFIGKGCIDMQGVWLPEKVMMHGYGTYRTVKVFALRSCTDVVFADLTVLRATDLCLWMYDCERVRIHALSLDVLVDGISPDACRDVVISDCIVKADDDAIVLKSSFTLGRRIACEHISISGCIISSNSNAVKIGTETNGDFRNITVTGCVIKDTHMAGLTVQSVDGAHVSGILFSNVTMDNVAVPIFLRLGARVRGPEGTEMGSMSDIMFRNIYARFPMREYATTPINLPGQRLAGETNIPFEYPSMIVGMVGHPIENLTFSDVTLVTYGGRTMAEALPMPLPEREDAYPNPNMFGRKQVLPTCGLLARHVRGVKMHNVTVRTLNPDERPTTLFDDAEDVCID